MPLDLNLSDLARLDRVRAALAENDPRSQFAPLGLREVIVSDDAADAVSDVIDRHLGDRGDRGGDRAVVRLIVDPVVIRRDGADLKEAVLARLAERYDARRVTLDDGHSVLHADDPVLDRAAEAAAGADCVVSVGGGTITDIAKIAAQRAGASLHVALQTAASVDGFTDNFSVVLRNGVKKTLPSRWPEAVLIDTRTIAEAPQALNAAGVGEMLSIYSAPGDWFLACEMGLDTTFAPVLLEILAICGRGIEGWSEGVGRGDLAACEHLAAALAMRGIVTGVGGTTAVLSGMEHLFSHMLDMVNGEKGGAMGLHGAQVGVGSVFRAAAWEEFRDRMDHTPLSVADLFPDPDTFKPQVEAAFAELDPSGRVGDECWSRFRVKMEAWHRSRPKVEAFFADWAANRDRHDALIFDAATMAGYLHRAQAPNRYFELEPAPSEATMRWTVGNCQFMRERFTVADLLTLAGWWDADGVDRVVARVEAACAAAEGADAR